MLLREKFIGVLNKKILLRSNLKEEECNRLKQIIKDEKQLPETIPANILIEKLDLTPLNKVTDEDGYFKEFVNTISEKKEEENCTEIFYLMKQKQTSCLHQLNTTETWEWLGGNDISLFTFSEEEVKEIILNEANATFTIEKNILFGAKNKTSDNNDNFGWVSCLCQPGFTRDHYKSPTSDELTKLRNNFPAYNTVIDELTPTDLKKIHQLAGSYLFTRLKTVSDKLNGDNINSVCNIL
jgi:predicted cupin superfamily sugar epimerase